MKAIIIVLGLGFGLFFSFLHKYDKKRPLYWKLAAILLVFVLIFFNFLPPLATTWEAARSINANLTDEPVPVLLKILPGDDSYDEAKGIWSIHAADPENSDNKETTLEISGKTLPPEFKAGNSVVALIKFDKEDNTFKYVSTEAVNPAATFPYIISLQERIRIMNVHVPVAWVAVLAYLVSMIFSIQYLRTKKLDYDIKAVSSAALGTMFCILATTTGMVWAKFNWGSFWNWDPRETSILFLLLIYAAYFALRSAIENEETKARLSSVYSIVAFVTVPFFVFIIPRITRSLHPGSASDQNTGPVLSGQADMLSSSMQVVFSIGLAAFTILFFWMLNLTIRYKKLERQNSLNFE